MEKKEIEKFLQNANYRHVKTNRRNAKEKLVKYKGGKCEICGYDKCVEALEFHHKNPEEKDFSISSYAVLSFKKLKEEADKCILVCANCHREIHSLINEEKRKKDFEKEKEIFLELFKNREEFKIKRIKKASKYLPEEEILNELKCGTKKTDIMAKYHIGRKTLNEFLDEHDVERPKKKIVYNKPTKEELSLMLEKLTKNAIAKIYNVSWHSVNKWCKKYGI